LSTNEIVQSFQHNDPRREIRGEKLLLVQGIYQLSFGKAEVSQEIRKAGSASVLYRGVPSQRRLRGNRACDPMASTMSLQTLEQGRATSRNNSKSIVLCHSDW
jgi:hypothetical protein